jgi:hypothetical protein
MHPLVVPINAVTASLTEAVAIGDPVPTSNRTSRQGPAPRRAADQPRRSAVLHRGTPTSGRTHAKITSQRAVAPLTIQPSLIR